MPTMRADISGGGRLTVGVGTFFEDYAVREMMVYGVQITEEMRQEAIEFCINTPEVSSFVYPGSQVAINLPLSSASGWRWGTDPATGLASVRVVLVYRRRRRGSLIGTNFNVATFRKAVRPVEWYRKATLDSAPNVPVFVNRMPAGDLRFPQGGSKNDPASPPISYVHRQVGWHIIKPYTLNTLPPQAIFEQVGTINQNTVLFAGRSFAPYTVLFDSLDIDWEIENNQPVYYSNYVFTAVIGGWVNQDAYLGDDGGNPPAPLWLTREGVAHFTTSGGVWA